MAMETCVGMNGLFSMHLGEKEFEKADSVTKTTMVLAVCFNLAVNREVNLSLKGFKPRLMVIRQIYMIGIPSINYHAGRSSSFCPSQCFCP